LSFGAADINVNDLIDLFFSLFPNRNDSMVKLASEPAWRQVSKFHKLSDEEILESIRTMSGLVRACRLDECMQFLVIRIPSESPYRQSATTSAIKDALREISVSAKHYEHLGDWYLYIFLADWIRCDVAGQLLAEWLIEAGFEVNEKSMEVLSPGAILPLPLQSGFSWINDKGFTLVRRDEISFESSVALFLSDLDKTATDVDLLVNALASRPSLNFAPPEIEKVPSDKVLLLPQSSMVGPPEFNVDGQLKKQSKRNRYSSA
jgi:hypothetical protein